MGFVKLRKALCLFISSVSLMACHADSNAPTTPVTPEVIEPVLAFDACHETLPLGTEVSFFTGHTISLNDAVSTALEKSFSSRIEFENLYQAKKRIKKAYVNLIPHFSGAAIKAVMNPTFLGVLGAIGDLVPFLMPTNWFQIGQTKIMDQIEQETQTLMRFDLAFEVEGLAYSLWRDQAIHEHYLKMIQLTNDISCRVQVLESHHQITEGSSDHVKSVLDALIRDEAVMKELLDEDRRTLSMVLGVLDPRDLTEIALPASEALPDSFSHLDSHLMTMQVENQSHELAQMGLMIELAHSRRKAAFFSWMDPTGFYAGGLNTGVGIMRSEENKTVIQREQTHADLLLKLDSTVEQYNGRIDDYAFDENDLSLQERRLNRVIDEIAPRSKINMLDFETVVQDALTSKVTFQSHLAEFRVSRAMIERLTGKGFYQH